MGLIAARCTQCGAEIEVDDTKESGICKYCGTTFITEKVINNYNTYVTHNYAGAIIKMNDSGKPEYMCPRCHSNETRAMRFKTTPPEAPKEPNDMVAIISGFIFSICCGGIFVYGIIKDFHIFITIVFGIIFFLCSIGIVVSYKDLPEDKKEYQKKKKEHEKSLYVWEHTYYCLRCGTQFFVNEDIMPLKESNKDI